MPRNTFPADAFGDRFAIDNLPLPRAPAGYAVQQLDTDTLLDRRSGRFLAVRASDLDGLFTSFDEAYRAACTWVEGNCPTPAEHRLAIVPAGFDPILERHILIYGVLRDHP
jgi:hypothetical protein